jgi:hypothetical protein
MNDDETFNEIISDYTFPPVTLDIADWPTEDLVTLSLKIDAELQKRADELDPPLENETLPWEE